MDLKLKKESSFYTLLQGAAGIPKLIWYGQDGDYNVMVTEILGPNIESLYNFCQRRFSVKTVLLIAD
jgi:predicted Ser/Thr protein kinase